MTDENTDLFGKIDALVLRRDPGGWGQDSQASLPAGEDFPLLTDIYAAHPVGDRIPDQSDAETKPLIDEAIPADSPPCEDIETLYLTLEQRLVDLAEKELAPRLQREVDSAMAAALSQIHAHIGVALRQAIADELVSQLSRHDPGSPSG
jgi:hypothetical protein